MSKSLKNFITIQDALSRNSSRELRIFFLLHQWKETLDYSDSAMEEASSYEKMLKEFFLNAKDLLRSGPTAAAAITAQQQQHFQKWSDAERELNQRFVRAKNRVRQALCDNIDTKTSLEAIKSLISDCNKYLARMKRSANRVLIKSVAEYVTRLFQIFGVIEGKQTLGFPSTESSAGGPGNDISAEEIVMPVLEALAEFREEVRKEARQLGAKSVLELCDRFRDDVLPSLGVRLEDREGQPPALKLVPRDELLKEKLLKEKLLKEKEERKDARQAELNRKKIQLEELREARDARRAALNHQ